MPHLKLQRKKSMKELLIPYFAVVNYDVDAFRQLVYEMQQAEKESGKKETAERFKEELGKIKFLPIQSGQCIEIDMPEAFSVFVSNCRTNDTGKFPFACSEQLQVDKDCSALVKKAGMFSGAELSLKITSGK